MKKIIGRILEVIFIVLLGIGLAACGKKTDEEVIGDEYGYLSTYRELKLANDNNGYITTQVVKGDILHYIFFVYQDEDYTKYTYEYHKYNLKDGSDSVVAFPADTMADYEYINKMSVNEDGTYTLLISAYDEKTYESQYSIKKLDGELRILSQYSLDKIITDEDYYIDNVGFSSDGIIYITTSSNIIALDSNGKELCRQPISGYLSAAAIGSDNRFYFTQYNYDTWKLELKVFDVATKSITVIDDISADNVNQMAVGLDGSLIFSGESVVKSVNPTTKETKTLWNWFEVDAADAYYGEIIQTGDEEYVVLYEDYSDETAKFYAISIHKELLTAENRKIQLLYGCTYLDSTVKRAITAFNRSNEKYRVIPAIASEEYGEDDIYTKYYQDITSGRFDIIDASSIYGDKFAAEGAFADLTDYYKKDIDGSKYNFLDLFDMNGKRYYVTYSVSAAAMLAPSKLVGNKTTVSLEDLIEYRKQYPDIAFFDYATKINVFYTCFLAAGDEFLDYSKATCSFNSDKFVKLLEFANTFPETIDYETYDSWELSKNGQILFSSVTLSDVTDYQVQKKLMGDDVKIVGYPTGGDSGVILSANDQIAISSKTKHMDGAWDFAKSLLDENVQDDVYSLPVLKASLEKKFTEASTPEYYTDENGNKVEYPKTTYGSQNGEIEVYAATTEEINQIREALAHAVKQPYVDDEIYEIMSEELDSFFKGAKTAQEIADILQSRVKIYMAEKY